MFSKGFVHNVLKLFISCFYAEKNLGKMPGDVLDGKKTCLSKTMKTSISPSRQIRYSLRGYSMILVKNDKIFHFLFLCKKRLEKIHVW